MITQDIHTWVRVAALTGGALSMGLGAIGSAIGEGYTASEANSAISRNPDMAGEVMKSMLVGQAIAESAAIFALVVSMIMLFSSTHSESLITAFAYLGAGLSMGFGAIGSGIGSGYPAAAACTGMVRQPAMSGQLMVNMLVGSAVCQTPSIFALVTSFILLFTDFVGHPFAPTWAALLGAGISAGISAIGPGIGGGLVAEQSCHGIARYPLCAGPLTNIMLLGQAITQTSAIYGLLIAFILIFKSYTESAALAPAAALLSAGICMGIGAIGSGVGEGICARSAVQWIARNIKQTGVLTRTMLVGMAVAESTAIYALVISMVLIFVM